MFSELLLLLSKVILLKYKTAEPPPPIHGSVFTDFSIDQNYLQMSTLPVHCVDICCSSVSLRICVLRVSLSLVFNLI